jgi:hypothetical protein
MDWIYCDCRGLSLFRTSMASFPAPAIASAGLLLAGLVAWFGVPGLREAISSTPLATLTGSHVGGWWACFTLILYSLDRLPLPFALVVGWGDIPGSTLAIPLSIALGAPWQEFAVALGLDFETSLPWLMLPALLVLIFLLLHFAAARKLSEIKSARPAQSLPRLNAQLSRG